MLFVNTLKAPFINHMLGGATKSFSDIVMSGEMIENAIRCGKIKIGENTKKSAPRRKENEVNNAGVYNKSYSKPVTVSQPKTMTTSHQGSVRQDSNPRPNTKRVQFTLILMSYRELYQSLFDAHVVSPYYLKPLQPPFPKWYDANAQCENHAGISGHTIENCTAFEKVVERLIGMGVVKFDEPTRPNVVGNPLPSHSDKGVNAIIEKGKRRTKMNVSEVKIPLKWVWKRMVERGLVAQDSKERPREARGYCEFHANEGHDIQKCNNFRSIVQKLMDNKEMEFYEEIEGSEEGEVHASEEGTTEGVQRVNHPVGSLELRLQLTIPGEENPASASRKNQDVGFYTRSGRRYDPAGTEIETVKGKTPIVEQRKEKMVRLELPINEPVTEKEAREFLKFLKHSEYSMVEQLHKQSARISVLALFLSLETHRSALMKVLNKTYVADDISINKLDRLVNNISTDNFIFFNDNEIPPGGIGSTKALHITTRCKGYTLLGVLIDNGSALNVLPLSMLNRLPVDSSHMKTCQNVVREFDGTKRKALDSSTGVVPSSLHQKLKFITEGRLVTVNAEEDIIASVTSDAPYVETNDEAIECSFRSLEFVNTTFIVEGNKLGKELGRNLQGRIEAPILTDKRDHFGLGYKPNTRSPDIKYMSSTATDSKSPFEQDMCTEDSQDFEDDRNCNLSPDL
ncbi:uncharacterized protein LOC108468597 [Gossypium arboreum]|uniref:uncharacterized protein LOC108468597 n=1 Tax=Gossypium arboreum TaxID=29729 RepID=UPI0022F1C81F|nr:uncharacterized protein LOC108468597 [Gossypium arboreum]